MIDSRTKQTLRHSIFLLLIAGVVMFANLGGPRLWDRDEPRNAGCAEEMLRRGDFVTPIFNDELRGQKPVLLYWLIISAYQVFGVNEFSARFWSAAFACGTVLLTYLCGKRMFNPGVGIWAAIALTSSLMFVVAGRAVTPDSILIFFVTASLTIFVYAAFPKKPNAAIGAGSEGVTVNDRSPFPRHWSVAAAMYGMMGIAILAKGPVGLILPTAIIGLYLLIVRLPESSKHQQRGRIARGLIALARTFQPGYFLKTCWSMRPITAILVALAVAAPWYILVGLQTNGDFLEAFFLREHFGRASTAMENHRGNIFYYPLAILVGFFPWSVFTVPLLITLKRRFSKEDPWRNGYLFAICWIAVWVGAFTIARTKLPSYATPCYPAVALLMGCFLQRWSERPTELPAYFYRIAIGCLIAVGLVIAIGLPIATTRLLGGQQWLLFVGLIPAVGGLLALYLQWRAAHQRAIFVLGATSVLFSLGLFAVAADVIGQQQRGPELLANVRVQQPGTAQPVIGAFLCMESSWTFYSKCPVHELTRHKNEIPFKQRANDWQPKPITDPNTFVSMHQDAYLLTTEAHLSELRNRVDCPLDIVSRSSYFLKKDQGLVLLRPAARVATEQKKIIR